MTDHDHVVDVPEPPETGDSRVDAATSGLAGLARRPVAEHVEAYEDVHRQLHEALADLDTAAPTEPTDEPATAPATEPAIEPTIDPPAGQRAS